MCYLTVHAYTVHSLISLPFPTLPPDNGPECHEPRYLATVSEDAHIGKDAQSLNGI